LHRKFDPLARNLFANGRLEVIKKVKSGYKGVSSKEKNLRGLYKTMEEAEKRLRQVEFFKHGKA
jgi:hypothetical protein